MIFAQQLRHLLLFGVLKARHCVYRWLAISRDIDSSGSEGLYIGIESICSLNLHLTKPLALSTSASRRMKSGSSRNIVEGRKTDLLKRKPENGNRERVCMSAAQCPALTAPLHGRSNQLLYPEERAYTLVPALHCIAPTTQMEL